MYKIKLAITLLLVIAMIFSVSTTTFASTKTEAKINVNINGISVNFNTDYGFPFIDSNNRTLVPLRITMEAYGCTVGWDQGNSTASVSKDETIVLVPIEKSYILIDGVQTPIDTSAQIINGRTYLPIRAVLEAFGATVGWDASTKTVTAINPDEAITYEIAMLQLKGSIGDSSFNQAAWDGIVTFATNNNIPHKYYLSENGDTSAIMQSIETAVELGAKIIVAPGFSFSEAVFLAQDIYSDVSFILIDDNPRNADSSITRTRSNTVGIKYKEEQAGYLAGYAIVKEGFKNLGFIGGLAVPAVVKYGYGFLQGAQDAATELQIDKVSVKYHYSNVFWETPEIQSMAEYWYEQGTEVIFAAAGMAGQSVITAAEAAGKYVIGVDIDQSVTSPIVFTSAMKGIETSVQSTLAAYYTGQFPGGESLLLGAAEDGVQLPMSTSKFKIFTQADYDEVYKALASGKIIPEDDTGADSPMGLDLPNITFIFIP